MKILGSATKTEKWLLSLTALFLCGLLGLAWHDRQVLPEAGITVTPSRAVAVEKVAPERALLDLNTAAEEELTGLPGIGAELAHRIVEYREANGSFESVEDIMEVSGIGEKKLEDLRPYVIVNEGSAP